MEACIERSPSSFSIFEELFPLAEPSLFRELLKFSHPALLSLIQINFLLQRLDLSIHILYDMLFFSASNLLGQFAVPDMVKIFLRKEVFKEEFREKAMSQESPLDRD